MFRQPAWAPLVARRDQGDRKISRDAPPRPLVGGRSDTGARKRVGILESAMPLVARLKGRLVSKERPTRSPRESAQEVRSAELGPSTAQPLRGSAAPLHKRLGACVARLLVAGGMGVKLPGKARDRLVRPQPAMVAGPLSPTRQLAPPPGPRTAGGVVEGEEQVRAAVAARVYGGLWRKPAFASHADARRFQQLWKVHELIRLLPAQALSAGVLGEGAETQVANAASRAELIASTIAGAAGPEGGTAASAMRSWKALQAYVQRHSLPGQGLPASKALVAEVVRLEGVRARTRGKGSQGGATTAKTLAEGFTFLQHACGLSIDADCSLVRAQTTPPLRALPRPRKHAASLPLCIQLQLETLADSPDVSVARTLARSLLVACLAQNARLNDALNSVMYADESDPAGVITGVTATRSKDGLPLFLYAPAEGWLGPWSWWTEHRLMMGSRKHAVPDYASKPAACPAQGTALCPGVLPKHKALNTLRGLCAMAPLCMSKAEFGALNITCHSPHGSGPDMIRYMGVEGGFTEGDARAQGHWLRDKNAPQEAPQRGQAARPAGAGNAREQMERRYTQGEGRMGERAEQLRVRVKLIMAVREALERFGRPWIELPRDLSSWEILLAA